MKIVGICRNPAEPFFWDAYRVGEPCPGCSTFDEPDFPHEFFVDAQSYDDALDEADRWCSDYYEILESL